MDRVDEGLVVGSAQERALVGHSEGYDAADGHGHGSDRLLKALLRLTLELHGVVLDAAPASPHSSLARDVDDGWVEHLVKLAED